MVLDVETAPLNSPNLRAAGFQRIDKDCFTTSYVRTQQAYASGYAIEGRALHASWDVDVSPGEKRPTLDRVLQASGFGTPILKPRAPRTQTQNVVKAGGTLSFATSEGKIKLNKTKAKENSGMSRECSKDRPKEKLNPRETQKAPQISSGKALSKKHPSDTDLEDEHAARLTERRERKRVKRAIVQPQEAIDHGNTAQVSGAPDSPSKNKKKSKGKNEKKTKVPASLALMHGFSANNIGKNRLTLKPGTLTGVFGKGKASAKTTVTSKKPLLSTKKGSDGNIFSEFNFLNNTTSKELSTPLVIESQSDSSDSDLSIPVRHKKKKRKVKDHSKEGQNRSAGAEEDSSPMKDEKTGEMEHQEAPKSEIWDIEIEGRGLPSEVTSATVSSKFPEGTVILKMPTIISGKTEVDLHREDAASGLDNHPKVVDGLTRPTMEEYQEKTIKTPERCGSASSSLAPSQSASQTCQERPETLSFAISKYFRRSILDDRERDILDADTKRAESSRQVDTLPSTFWYATDVDERPDHMHWKSGLAVQSESLPGLTSHSAVDAPSGSYYVQAYGAGNYDQEPSGPAPGLALPFGDSPQSVVDRPISSSLVNSLDLALQTYEMDNLIAGGVERPIVEMENSQDDFFHTDDDTARSLPADTGVLDGFSIWDPEALLFSDQPISENAMYCDFPYYDQGTEYGDEANAEYIIEDKDETNLSRIRETLGEDLFQYTESRQDSQDEEEPYYANYYLEGDIHVDQVGGLLYDGQETGDTLDDDSVMDDLMVLESYDSDVVLGDDAEASDIRTASRPLTSDSEASIGEEYNGCEDAYAALGSQFCQGRALLLGISDETIRRTSNARLGVVTRAEKDVARNLKGHWLPQKL